MLASGTNRMMRWWNRDITGSNKTITRYICGAGDQSIISSLHGPRLFILWDNLRKVRVKQHSHRNCGQFINLHAVNLSHLPPTIHHNEDIRSSIQYYAILSGINIIVTHKRIKYLQVCCIFGINIFQYSNTLFFFSQIASQIGILHNF